MNWAPNVAVSDLSLVRGWRTLVSDLSFDVEAGGGLALRGPNGSGKTTLLRALAGLHTPRSGQIAITMTDGSAKETEDAASLIGFLGHLDAIKPGQAVREQLLFWASLAGDTISLPDSALQLVGLTRQADLPGGVLSAGQRRRLALARLIVSQRPVWLLDEPAAPLDADGRAMLGRLLDDHRARGGIVITAVHDTPPGAAMDMLELAS